MARSESFSHRAGKQLIIDSWPSFRAMALQGKARKLKKELEEKGYFDQRAKKPLPDIMLYCACHGVGQCRRGRCLQGV